MACRQLFQYTASHITLTYSYSNKIVNILSSQSLVTSLFHLYAYLFLFICQARLYLSSHYAHKVLIIFTQPNIINIIIIYLFIPMFALNPSIKSRKHHQLIKWETRIIYCSQVLSARPAWCRWTGSRADKAQSESDQCLDVWCGAGGKFPFNWINIRHEPGPYCRMRNSKQSQQQISIMCNHCNNFL